MRTTQANRYGEALHALTKDLPEKEAREVVDRFVDWLAGRRQTYLVDGILDGFAGAARRSEGTVRVAVSTAEEPDATQKDALEAAITSAADAPVEIGWTTDPALIGGAVIRYGDALLDASVKGKLARIKKHLTADL